MQKCDVWNQVQTGGYGQSKAVINERQREFASSNDNRKTTLNLRTNFFGSYEKKRVIHELTT